MKHSPRLSLFLVFAVCALLAALSARADAPAGQLNLLIITVDDMSCDSLGVFGCKLAETSPHIDQLATQCLRFEYAHVQVGNCMPCRNVLFSGRYSHNNHVEGFRQVRDPGYPVLCDLLQQAGYFTAIRGKVAHSTPYTPYAWDLNLDTGPDGKQAHIKDAASYGISTTQGIEAARKAHKPFCLVVNVSDPHKPFYAEGKGGTTVPDAHVPSRVFRPEEVPIPGFLFDDPVVRKELSHYYSSVRRADDAVGSILQALEASREKEQTMIVFLSDHGMPLPFAKTQLYHHSTHTPLMVRWPGVTKPGAHDTQHMVSAIDVLPTLLEMATIKHPAGLEGRSFVPLLQGKEQSDRNYVIKEYNENAGGNRSLMRGVQTKQFLYLFNPWSNGKRVMATATAGTSTNRQMIKLAANNPKLAARVDLLQHRVQEELYDVQQDPDCLNNLIASPGYQAEITRLREILATWMEQTGDPLLKVFQNRDDVVFREKYIEQDQQAVNSRSKKKSQPKADE